MSETETNQSKEQQKLDIIAIARDLLHSFRRTWLIVLVLTAACAAVLYFRSSTNYTPTYVSEATVSVEIVNGGTYANKNTAEQMGKIFPYILTSGALSDIIAADLKTNGVPGNIWVNCISGTNLLTINVMAYDPNTSYRILQSVLKNYPEVAQYVVGQTELTVIDDSGIPEDTGRTSVVRGSLKKGALIGFAAGMVIVVLRAFTFRTIRSETELRSILNLPCIGTLPAIKKKKRRHSTGGAINILNDSNRGSYEESMRLIRTRLERQLEDKKVLMVTSSVAGEGKSTVAANLAISMALKGKNVILVDCDLRNPSVSGLFGIKKSCPGIVAVINGKVRLEDAILEVDDDRIAGKLLLIPGAERESRLVEVLSSAEMGAVVDELRTMADVVILDTPPSAVLVDAMMLVCHVDAIAYVVMSDYARRRSILDGVEELSAGGAPIVGCILNGGEAHSGSYGYYGYYNRYGSYGYGGYKKSRYYSSGKSGHRHKKDAG